MSEVARLGKALARLQLPSVCIGVGGRNTMRYLAFPLELRNEPKGRLGTPSMLLRLSRPLVPTL